MIFEWDEKKNETNKVRHHISFEDARYVFADPFAVTRVDYNEEEPRLQIMGHIGTVLLVLAVYTMRKRGGEEVIRIISHGRLHRRRENGMKKTRGFSPLTKEQRQRFEKLSKLPDSEIDTSDINEWSDEDFAEAKLFEDVYKPKKQQITARIDVDVLMWLKSHGKGYQTLMNDLLRKEMFEELNHSS